MSQKRSRQLARLTPKQYLIIILSSSQVFFYFSFVLITKFFSFHRRIETQVLMSCVCLSPPAKMPRVQNPPSNNIKKEAGKSVRFGTGIKYLMKKGHHEHHNLPWITRKFPSLIKRVQRKIKESKIEIYPNEKPPQSSRLPQLAIIKKYIVSKKKIHRHFSLLTAISLTHTVFSHSPTPDLSQIAVK